MSTTDTTTAVLDTNVPKKRGRRKKMVEENEIPKTNSKKSSSKKITDMKDLMAKDLTTKQTNTILYLNCHIKDIDQYIQEQKWKTDNLTYDPKVPFDFVPFDWKSSMEPYTLSTHNSSSQLSGASLEGTISNNPSLIPQNGDWFVCQNCAQKMPNSSASPIYSNQNNTRGPSHMKEELQEEDLRKIKDLKVSFYKNEIPDKKVDCFWCTCPFDNDPSHILQHGSDKEVLAHGSFCSPECAVAHLFSHTNWDDSAKMDSYRLMNHFYGSSNQNSNNQNIKPACSPYYFLDKYYGNMTIQEFRRLSKSSNVMLCIDKPVTRLLPEIHEDTEKQFINGSSTQHRGNYKVKKQSEKVAGPSRNAILRDNFRGGSTISAAAI